MSDKPKRTANGRESDHEWTRIETTPTEEGRRTRRSPAAAEKAGLFVACLAVGLAAADPFAITIRYPLPIPATSYAPCRARVI